MPALFFSPIARFSLAVLLAATVYAIWRGDRLVRLAAFANTGNWLLVNALQPKHGAHVDAAVFPAAQFAIDLVFALTFASAAVATKRTWLAVMSAFLLVGVANYASHFSEMRLWHRAFITASYLWGYGALACLVVGAMTVGSSRASPLKPGPDDATG